MVASRTQHGSTGAQLTVWAPWAKQGSRCGAHVFSRDSSLMGSPGARAQFSVCLFRWWWAGERARYYTSVYTGRQAGMHTRALMQGYTCMHMHTQAGMHRCTCMHTEALTYTHKHMQVSRHAHKCTHIGRHPHTCGDMNAHICRHACTHMHTQVGMHMQAHTGRHAHTGGHAHACTHAHR